MNRITKIAFSIAGFSFLLTGVAAAQTEHSANRMGTDSTFITKAAHGGMAEVELGRVAQSRASSQKVKDFGQRMIDDHSKANDELSKIAGKQGVTVPTGMSASDQATKDKLSALSGHEFDVAYMQDMVKDHREDISEFQKEANSGRDSDVKAFASQTLPTLREHLRLAEQTLAEIKK